MTGSKSAAFILPFGDGGLALVLVRTVAVRTMLVENRLQCPTEHHAGARNQCCPDDIPDHRIDS